MTPGTTSPARRRIAIIGGGVSGAALLLALLRQAQALEVVVYEPEAEIGPGLAYGAAAPWHLLNVVATRASLYADDPDHWWRWARTHGPALGWPETAEAGPEDYLPRRLFGHYVAQELDAARRQPGPVRVLHHRTPAADIDAGGSGGVIVADAEGRAAQFDTAVLATGAPSSPHFDLPGLSEIRRQWNWIDDPWDLPLLAKIPRDEPVLIVGSALTMADTVLSLGRQDHRGPIHVLSRHGVVPVARHEQPTLPTGISADDAVLPVSQLLHRLRRAVQIHGQEKWQGVFEGLRDCTNDLWTSLPPEAQRRFMRHLKALWDAHRFRMPPTTAATLDQMRCAGQIRFHKGSLQRLVPRSGGGIGIEYRPRGHASSHVLSVAAIVDCTGPRRPETDWAGHLLDRMLARGLLTKAACGVGLQATPQGAVLADSGSVVPGLHLIGPVLRGTLLESTAISEIRIQADALAVQLAQSNAELRNAAQSR